MRFKKVIPYIFFGSALIGTTAHNTAPDIRPTPITNGTKKQAYVIDFIKYTPAKEYETNSQYLDNKADSLCDLYINNMLAAQQKLKPLIGTQKYYRAVREMLPGAPVGYHCLYGQFTHLARALDKMGDTLTIIPEDARMACFMFKKQMRKKYSTNSDCIYEGVMHKSDNAYNAALSRYLRCKNVTDETPDSVRMQHIAHFAQKNFSADAIKPGAILIVPRHRDSRNTFHAIMFLGRGHVENNIFTPDSAGQHIYVGHNRENIGDLFKTYDMSSVFVANTRNIVRAEYQQELTKIESMSREQLIEYLSPENATLLAGTSHDRLLHMARNKYFNQPQLTMVTPHKNTIANAIITPTGNYITFAFSNQKLR